MYSRKSKCSLVSSQKVNILFHKNDSANVHALSSVGNKQNCRREHKRGIAHQHANVIPYPGSQEKQSRPFSLCFTEVYVKKMVFSTYKKQRVLVLASHSLKAPMIAKELQKENLNCSRVGVHKFLRKFEETGSITRTVGSGRPLKVTAEIKQIAEKQMCKDDEATAYQLHHLLSEKGYSISLHMILRCRTTLGWTFHGSTYCPLIREQIR